MKNLILILAMAAILFYGSGCATILSSDSQNITFNSEPQGANIKVGPYECITPCSLKIPKGQQYVIEASYAGEKKIVPLTKKMAGSTFWNILFWPGFLVDAITGNIKKYEPEHYSFNFSM